MFHATIIIYYYILIKKNTFLLFLYGKDKKTGINSSSDNNAISSKSFKIFIPSFILKNKACTFKIFQNKNIFKPNEEIISLLVDYINSLHDEHQIKENIFQENEI